MATNTSWDPEELRKNARVWTLEGDANLLNLMKNISNNLEQHANKTTKDLNEISEKLDRTSISLDNTVNRLGMLSQTQFVENRVHDDDDEISVKKRRLESAKINEYSESTPYDPIETLNTIIKNNMKMLGSCYEKVTIDLDDSDDEDSNIKSVIYRPKNPYESQPMPYLIGSKEWHEKWHIGLSDSDESEQNSCEEDNISESISLPSNGPTVSESGSSVWSLNRQQQQTAKNLTILQKNVSNKYSTPLSSDEEISSQTVASKTSSSEGASRIINNNEITRNLPEERYYVHKPSGLNSSDSDASANKVPQPAPRPNKIQNIAPTQISNIFNDEPPELTEPVKDGKMQNKSTTKMFYESDEENDNLFQKKVERKPNQSASNQVPSIKKKVVNLFDDEDFDSFMKELDKKTTQKASEVDSDHIKNIPSNDSKRDLENLENCEAHNNIAQLPAQYSSSITKKNSTNKINIFEDDDDDVNELFLPTAKPKKISDLKTKLSNLFDDEPPDDDFDSLFDSSKSSTKDKHADSLTAIDSSITFTKEPSQSNSLNKNAVMADKTNVFEQPVVSSISHPKIPLKPNHDLITNNIPSNDAKGNETEIHTEQSSDSIIVQKKLTNLFDSDGSEDENIFSKVPKGNQNEKQLISEENEKPIVQPLTNRTKVNIFDSDISDDEEFFSKKLPPTPRDESNNNTLFKSNGAPEVTKTNLFDSSLFDGDSLIVEPEKSDQLPNEDKQKEFNSSLIDPINTLRGQLDVSIINKTEPKNRSEKLDKIIVNKTVVPQHEIPNEIDYNKIKLISEEASLPILDESNSNNLKHEPENKNQSEELFISGDSTNLETTKHQNPNVEEIAKKHQSGPDIVSEMNTSVPTEINSINDMENHLVDFSDSNVPEFKRNSEIPEHDLNVNDAEEYSDDTIFSREPISGENAKLATEWLDSGNENLNISSSSNLDSSSITFSPHFISNEPPEDFKSPSEITDDPVLEEEDLFASPVKMNTNNTHNISSSALPYDPIGLFQDIPPPDEGDIIVKSDNEFSKKFHSSNVEDVSLKNQMLEDNLVEEVPTPKTEDKVLKIPEIENRANISSMEERPKKNLVKKLSTDLKINVAALIPGSKRPGLNVHHNIKEQIIGKEEIDGNILIKSKNEEKLTILPKSENLTNSGLTHLNKSRPKILVKRRPQSRESRQESYRKSNLLENMEDDPSDINNGANLSIKESNSNISNQINSKNLPFGTKTVIDSADVNVDNSVKTVTKRSIIFDDTEDQDWFADVVAAKSQVTNKKNNKQPTTKEENQIKNNIINENPSERMENVERANVNPEIVKESLHPVSIADFSQNLLSADSTTKKVDGNKVDENFPSKALTKGDKRHIESKPKNTLPIKTTKSVKDPLFLDSDSEDNDLFNQTSGSIRISSNESIKSKISDALNEPASFLETSNVEEIFKKVIVKPKKIKTESRTQIKAVSLFSSDDDDDDLFGSISNKKPTTTKKEPITQKVFRKKPSNTTRLFDDVDDDDDLFGNTSKNISNKDLGHDPVSKQNSTSKSSKTTSESITQKPTKYNPLADLLNDN